MITRYFWALVSLFLETRYLHGMEISRTSKEVENREFFVEIYLALWIMETSKLTLSL